MNGNWPHGVEVAVVLCGALLLTPSDKLKEVADRLGWQWVRRRFHRAEHRTRHHLPTRRGRNHPGP